MAGDPTNARQWLNADVYLNDTPGTAGPTTITGAWPTGFNAAGLLDGEEGFTHGRDEETSERYAWGSILVKKSRSKHKRTIRFVCLEDNAVTFGLVNPGSTRTTVSGTTTSVVKVPQVKEFAIGFELKEGNKVKRRTVKRATVEEIGEIKESESDVTAYEVTVVILPEADGTLYTEVEGTTV